MEMLPRAWAASYQRNNKMNGRKNLRCFVRERRRRRRMLTSGVSIKARVLCFRAPAHQLLRAFD